ncbi:hypothetical protein PMAYCL1PPCAC_31358, partial [Pristionchus mayeri]
GDLPNESPQSSHVGWDQLPFDLFEQIADYARMKHNDEENNDIEDDDDLEDNYGDEEYDGDLEDDDVARLLKLRLVSKGMKANIDAYMTLQRNRPTLEFIRFVEMKSRDISPRRHSNAKVRRVHFSH